MSDFEDVKLEYSVIIRMTKEDRDKFHDLCKSNKITMSGQIRKMVRKFNHYNILEQN